MEGTGWFCSCSLKEAFTVISIACFQKLTHIPIFIWICLFFIFNSWPYSDQICVVWRPEEAITIWDKDGNKLNINLKAHPNFLRTKTCLCRTNLENFLYLFACLFANHSLGLFQHSHNVRCSKFLIYRVCLLLKQNYPFKFLPYFQLPTV